MTTRTRSPFGTGKPANVPVLASGSRVVVRDERLPHARMPGIVMERIYDDQYMVEFAQPVDIGGVSVRRWIFAVSQIEAPK